MEVIDFIIGEEYALSKHEGGNAIKITIYGELSSRSRRNKFRYLGPLISDDGTCTEIKSKIAVAKNLNNSRRELLSKKMNKDLKKKLIKTFVWSDHVVWKNWLKGRKKEREEEKNGVSCCWTKSKIDETTYEIIKYWTVNWRNCWEIG